MSKKRVIEFTEDEIRGYLAKRHTLATLGEAHNAAKDTVSRSLLALGREDIKARFEENRVRGSAKLSLRQIEEIIARTESGEHPIDFAYEYDMDVSAIRYHLRKAGVKARRAQPKQWEDPTPQRLVLRRKIADIIPNTRFTQFHSMMTRAMQT